MINFPIVDSHVHLWDPQRFGYQWLEEVPPINRAFLPVDYSQAVGDIQVEKFVFVQCGGEPAYDEAMWIASLASSEPRLQGIVAHAPLELGRAATNDVAKLADIPLVKGVRRLIQSEELDFCLRPNFIAGVQLLAEFDLSFDLCIYHRHLAKTIELVQLCPDVKFVLDHLGKPDVKEQLFDPWREQLTELSQLPNVWCKISGLVTEADFEQWQPEQLAPYILHAIETFGFDRVMFGGDWPVITLASRLDRWMNVLGNELHNCSASESQKLFRDNAIAFYRLDS